MNKAKSGFTIVELLIAVVVVSILTSIAVFAYNGVIDGTRAAAVSSDLVNAKKKLLLYKIEQGSSPDTPAELSAAGIKASKSSYDTTGNNFYYCLNTNSGSPNFDEFAIGVRTVSNKASYIITSNGSLQLQGSNANAARTCQALGLVDDDDVNAHDNTGYSTSTGWASWVQ